MAEVVPVCVFCVPSVLSARVQQNRGMEAYVRERG